MSTRTNTLVPDKEFLDTFAPVSPVELAAPLLAHQTSDLFGLWLAWEERCGIISPVPFWAIVWPAAIIMARFLLEQPHHVAGKMVCEIGCGGGFASVAAAHCGASNVLANDTDACALAVSQFNASLNKVGLTTSNADFVHELLPTKAQVFLIADFFYERHPSRLLHAALSNAMRDRGVSVLVADSGRPFTPPGEVLYETTAMVDKELEGVSSRTVRILKLTA